MLSKRSKLLPLGYLIASDIKSLTKEQITQIFEVGARKANINIFFNLFLQQFLNGKASQKKMEL
jgi:hypothetical protein